MERVESARALRERPVKVGYVQDLNRSNVFRLERDFRSLLLQSRRGHTAYTPMSQAEVPRRGTLCAQAA